MSSSAAPIGTFFFVICIVLQVVGVATEYWMVVSVLSGTVQSHAGLFKLCYEVLSKEFCTYYISYADSFMNIHYIGIVGCSGLACILLAIACLIGFCGCSRPYQKPTVQNIGGVGLFGGLFSAAGVLWFYLYFFRGTFGDAATVLAAFGVDFGPGWSFYLCCAAAGLSILLSIILMIVGCNMESQSGSVVPFQQPATVIAMSGGQYPGPHQPSVVAMQNSAYNDPFAPSQNYNYDQKNKY